MKLEKLVNDINLKVVKGSLNTEINKVVYDSRKVQLGCLFIAIEGLMFDGHDFIKEAINRGAKAIIAQKNIQTDDNITIIIVKNTRRALAKISAQWYGHPSKQMELIGVTGTNGKTTTTYLIKSILEASKRNVGLIGTMGNLIGNRKEKTNHTTPESLDLQNIFYDMLKEELDTCVMEVSSHSLEFYRVEECYFNIGIFTNLTSEHLDLHKNLENYLNVKLKLFHKTKDYNIINADDHYGKKIINLLNKSDVKLIKYGIKEEADIYASNIINSVKGVKFILNTPKGNVHISMNIPGIFSVYNALSAAGCGYALDISLNDIKKGLESVKGIKGRFEIVPTNTDYNVIIDYAHTPDGYEKILQTVKQFAKGRIIIIFGCGGDRDRGKRPVIGEIAAKFSDLCIITTDNSRSEDPNQIIQDILKGVNKVCGNYKIIPDRRDAIKYSIISAKPKDIILLVGKGHEMHQIIGDKVLPFNERQIVLDLIEEK